MGTERNEHGATHDGATGHGTAQESIRLPEASQSFLGIVIPVEGEYAHKVSATRAATGDPFAYIPPHITLMSGVPLTDPAEAIAHVRNVVSAFSSFPIRFAGTDTFYPVSPVTYLRVAEGERELTELHERLHAGPLDSKPAFPFVPHLTLAQEIAPERLAEVRREWEDVSFNMAAHSVTVHVGDGAGAWTQIEELVFNG
ncbi:2'-5' RNA ligase family protein [Pseudoglutamicibacter cumminsii]|uniref:2'-5' RNA ligase family protein n=1 Tax=Pseudoglutamicibacter cumminsii TaxID=156979 RepID=UPI0021A46E9C|nr:2'-5' RNA ligase family protein [Pseudoglutamicibacter cumminsii]MCT1686661.1 2'-5' RNA ligase family protein [Pseudoglutamicibacter cumminsii]